MNAHQRRTASRRRHMLKFWVVITASKGSKLEFAAIGESSMDVTIDMAEQYPHSKVEVRPL